MANTYASFVALPLGAVVAFIAGPGLLGGTAMVEMMGTQLLIVVPSVATFLSLIYSVMFEFSESSQAASTDMLNWLPVTPVEYVLGSTLCTSYFISPMVSLVIGVSLGLALHAGMELALVVSVVLALVGVLLGTSVSEIARALLNRVSGTLYKRAGAVTMAARLFIGVIMIAALALVFNVNFFFRILQWFAGGIARVWFVPMLWPSMAVVTSLQGSLNQALTYSVLSLSFATLCFGLAVATRGRHWVPAPVGARLGASKAHGVGTSLLVRLGFDSAEAALVRKDLRSLTRRREMMIWIAIPVMLFLMTLVSPPASIPGATSIVTRLASFAPMGLGVLFLGFYLALVGFGQEGDAFINILGAPLQPRQVARAKLTVSVLPASAFLAIALVIMGATVKPRWETMLAMSMVAVPSLLEAALIGLAFGARYADFTEVPRARFIRREGAYLGLFAALAAVAATVLPLYLHNYVYAGHVGLIGATALALIIAAIICLVSLRATLSWMELLYRSQTA